MLMCCISFLSTLMMMAMFFLVSMVSYLLDCEAMDCLLVYRWLLGRKEVLLILLIL